MTEPQPPNDFASFPAPAEGILMAMFITVREVARSRDFYSRVLGGTVILEENPCTVRLSNSWIIMNPGGETRRGGRDPPALPRREALTSLVVCGEHIGGRVDD